ncbi:MAG: hypothetical protein KZQ92_00415 [Candidatus Thiodiazotropha sp. (ex Lucinoma borealis)]|nr:hypothetical protein [Candidatus Thiodiazotropha sp. (ex Lucinoma borealis)]
MDGKALNINMKKDPLALTALKQALKFGALSESDRDTLSSLLMQYYGKEISEYEIATFVERLILLGLRPTGRDSATVLAGERFDVSASTASRLHTKYFQN